MNILYILIPVGLLLSAAGALAFRWAVRNGQMDDPDYGSLVALMDDEDLPRIIAKTGTADDTI